MTTLRSKLCAGCNQPLTDLNARVYRGKWATNKCRKCEKLDTIRRARARNEIMLAVAIPASLHAQLRAQAETENRSNAYLVRAALTAFLAS